MKIALTGAHGFLGWHLRARLSAMTDAIVVPIGRPEVLDRDGLAMSLQDVDTVIHVAGASRGDPAEVAAINIELAHQLVEAIERSGGSHDIVFANSTQAESDTSYGASKATAANALELCAAQQGSRFVDVVLPNLFGEHGRPYYNSFVATFCHEVGQERVPEVHDSSAEVELLHVQDAAHALIDALTTTGNRIRPAGVIQTVGDVLDQLTRMHRTYRGPDLPEVRDAFERSLFSTYRSSLFPHGTPVELPTRTDNRGSLVEAVRNRSGEGQTFVSTTLPGQIRGDHYHFQKFERFLVLKGTAEIRLRRVLHHEVLRFRVSGSEPAFVDMPALWAHAIENVGDDELVTLFWADELFDADRPDTFREVVSPALEAAA
jgi:UDP-2-acetamido-2,6-beta-L-arabino-hexul-4-ose reductase